MESGDVNFDAKLGRDPTEAGFVHGPDGRPLAAIGHPFPPCSSRSPTHNGKFHESAYPHVITGFDGGFGFTAQTEPFRVFVSDARGFAEAEDKMLARSPELTIHPGSDSRGP